VTINDDSTLPMFGSGVFIDNTKYGDVIHIHGVGTNPLSIYCIKHTNKKVEFWLDRLIVKEINDMFKVVSSECCDEYE
jgi:hypothetical protein